MPAGLFDELASGGGSPEAIRFLERGERGRRLILLSQLLEELTARPGVLGPLGEVDAAWRVLARAADHAPEQVEELLLSPQAGGWLAHLLRRLHRRATGPELWADAGHLLTLGLTASVAAGLNAELTVPVHDGELVLPTLGLARLAGGRAPGGVGTARARLRGAKLELTGAAGTVIVRPLSAEETPHWLPLRRLDLPPRGDGEPAGAAGRRHPDAAGPWLDDLDRYRDLDGLVAPDRLDAAEAARWQRLFRDAVTILRADGSGPGQLRAADIRRVVPWRAASPVDAPALEPVRSASTGDAFGSMLITRPATALALAETLVHEFQHSKLGALLHLFPLLHDDRAEIHYAPWRSDPRHLTGLLHGAYAFLGVTGFWRDRMADKAADPTGTAAFRFALYRLQTRRVLRTLLAPDALTDVGARLVRGLTRTADGWLREPVDPAVGARAVAATASHRVEWRLRNLRCPDAHRAAFAEALRAGRPVGPRTAPPVPIERALLRHWTDGRTACYADPPPAPPPGAPADALLAAGAAEDARRRYARDLRRDPDDRHALAGWLLAAARCRPSHRRLLRRPEEFPTVLEMAGIDIGDDRGMRRAADWYTRPEARPEAVPRPRVPPVARRR